MMFIEYPYKNPWNRIGYADIIPAHIDVWDYLRKYSSIDTTGINIDVIPDITNFLLCFQRRKIL